MQWFRMWAEAVDDAKLRILAYEDRWHFTALLCLKAQGVLDEPDKELRLQMICTKFGMDSAELEKVMKRLVTVGLVSESWQPRNWGKRQFVSDSSTNRVRAFRKRSRNVSETDQIQNRTDTDTEQKKKGAPPALPVDGLDLGAWGRWIAYRKGIGKPVKPPSVLAAQKRLASFGASQADVVEKSIANGWQGLFSHDRRTPEPEPANRWEPPDDEDIASVQN